MNIPIMINSVQVFSQPPLDLELVKAPGAEVSPQDMSTKYYLKLQMHLHHCATGHTVLVRPCIDRKKSSCIIPVIVLGGGWIIAPVK